MCRIAAIGVVSRIACASRGDRIYTGDTDAGIDALVVIATRCCVVSTAYIIRVA